MTDPDDAIKYLNDNFKEEYIDEEFICPKNIWKRMRKV